MRCDSIELSGENQQKLEISINSKNQYLIADQLEPQESVKAILAEQDKQTRIILRVDKKVNFEHFVTIIDLLKLNQLNKLSIITRQN